MNQFSPVTDMRDIDRAVVSAATLMRDFSASSQGRTLSPMQFLSVMSIAAFDLTLSHGAAPADAAAKLRQIADALERG